MAHGVPNGVLPPYTGQVIRGRPQPFGPHGADDSGPVDTDYTLKTPSNAYPGPLRAENRAWWKQEGELQWAVRALDPNNVLFTRVFEQTGKQQATAFARALYASPVFDLMSYLGSSMGADQTQAIPLPRGGAYGAGGGVVVRFTPVDFTQITDLPPELEAYSMEAGNPVNGTEARVLPIKVRQNVSVDFFDGNSSTSLKFYAPPAQLRFWRCIIVFDWLRDPAVQGANNDPPRLQYIAAAT